MLVHTDWTVAFMNMLQIGMKNFSFFTYQNINNCIARSIKFLVIVRNCRWGGAFLNDFFDVHVPDSLECADFRQVLEFAGVEPEFSYREYFKSLVMSIIMLFY